MRTGGHAPGAFLRPAVARGDEAEVEEAAIAHGAGGGADIFGELRADQDDDRRWLDGGKIGAAVTAGHELTPIILTLVIPAKAGIPRNHLIVSDAGLRLNDGTNWPRARRSMAIITFF